MFYIACITQRKRSKTQIGLLFSDVVFWKSNLYVISICYQKTKVKSNGLAFIYCQNEFISSLVKTFH